MPSPLLSGDGAEDPLLAIEREKRGLMRIEFHWAFLRVCRIMRRIIAAPVG
jgi:hypothetical protein